MICDSCNESFFDGFFDGQDEWLKENPHLGFLKSICKRCRAISIPCNHCGLRYPATSRYFYERRNSKGKKVGKFGVRPTCRTCFSSLSQVNYQKRLMREKT